MGNWTLPMNLAGVTPMDPTRSGLPTGAYEVTILDSESKPSQDPTKAPNIVFDCQVAKGDHAGAGISIYMGTDMSKKGNMSHWKTLLLGIGAPADAVDKPLTVGPTTFTGKTAYIYVQARNPDEKNSFDQRNFITKEKFAAVSSVPAASGIAAGATAAPQPNGAGMANLAAALGGQPAPAAAPQPAAAAPASF